VTAVFDGVDPTANLIRQHDGKEIGPVPVSDLGMSVIRMRWRRNRCAEVENDLQKDELATHLAGMAQRNGYGAGGGHSNGGK
jgi:hypothetical protein